MKYLREKNEKQPLFGLQRNQRKVAECLKARKYDMVVQGGWAILDDFFMFLEELGIMELLKESCGTFIRLMVLPLQFILLYIAKILIGVQRMNEVPEKIFKDSGLMKIIGFTNVQIKGGLCGRGDVNQHGKGLKKTVWTYE